MVDFSRPETAERAGISLEDLNRFVELGIVTPGEGGEVELKGVAGAVHLHAAHRP